MWITSSVFYFPSWRSKSSLGSSSAAARISNLWLANLQRGHKVIFSRVVVVIFSRSCSYRRKFIANLITPFVQAQFSFRFVSFWTIILRRKAQKGSLVMVQSPSLLVPWVSSLEFDIRTRLDRERWSTLENPVWTDCTVRAREYATIQAYHSIYGNVFRITVKHARAYDVRGLGKSRNGLSRDREGEGERERCRGLKRKGMVWAVSNPRCWYSCWQAAFIDCG